MNVQKYETYKSMHESLSKTLKNEFYYEAIFIEYAILEDRLASVLKYAEIPSTDKNGQDVSIKVKLNRIESRKELSDKFYKDRLTPALIQESPKHKIAFNALSFAGFRERKGVFYLLAGRKSAERVICSENCAILNSQCPGADASYGRCCFSL